MNRDLAEERGRPRSRRSSQHLDAGERRPTFRRRRGARLTNFAEPGGRGGQTRVVPVSPRRPGALGGQAGQLLRSWGWPVGGEGAALDTGGGGRHQGHSSSSAVGGGPVGGEGAALGADRGGEQKLHSTAGRGCGRRCSPPCKWRHVNPDRYGEGDGALEGDARHRDAARYGEGDGALEGYARHRDSARYGDVASRYGEGDGALEGDARHRDPARYGDVASRQGDGDGTPEGAARRFDASHFRQCASVAVPGSVPCYCLPRVPGSHIDLVDENTLESIVYFLAGCSYSGCLHTAAFASLFASLSVLDRGGCPRLGRVGNCPWTNGAHVVWAPQQRL